jgi:pimeloyl-ACP methyl ester carboxylesterase
MQSTVEILPFGCVKIMDSQIFTLYLLIWDAFIDSNTQIYNLYDSPSFEYSHHFGFLLEQPTLIMWGEQDQVFPLELGYRLKR